MRVSLHACPIQPHLALQAKELDLHGFVSVLMDCLEDYISDVDPEGTDQDAGDAEAKKEPQSAPASTGRTTQVISIAVCS